MAQDGAEVLVVRQPTSSHGSPAGMRPILLPAGWRGRNLRALQSATGEEAKPNEYVETNTERLNGRNNNESPNSRSSESVSGDENSDVSRTDLIVLSDPKQGKTKVIKVVKCDESESTTNTALHGNSEDKLSKEPFPCPQCGYCRCDKCRQSNTLPTVWCCNGRCECSPESALDICTCLCCVKCIFYHSAKDSGSEYNYCLDDPCSCRPHRRCARWTCVGLLSLVLPCLCCYLPARGALEAYRQCYSQGRQGCQCSSRWETRESYDSL